MDAKDVRSRWNGEPLQFFPWINVAWFCYGWWQRESMVTLKEMGVPWTSDAARSVDVTRQARDERQLRQAGGDSRAFAAPHAPARSPRRSTSSHQLQTRTGAHRALRVAGARL